MADSSKSGIDGFTSIASNVSLYRPSTILSGNNNDNSPALLVLCSWMGAAPKHIAKYTRGYQDLFPNTAILLVQSSLADTFDDDKKQRPRIEVACRTILSFKSQTSNGPVLLHLMSNGGAIATLRMAKVFRERESGKIFNRVILDCSPSKPNAKLGARAVAFGLPNNWLIRWIGQWLIRIWMVVGLFIEWLRGREDILTKMRRRLNDWQMLDPTSPRMYMYSKADELVPPEDVHDHAVDARERGHDAREVVFEDAPHCALVAADPTLYWNSVKDFLAGTWE